MSPNNYVINGERVSADQYNKIRYEDLRIRVQKGRKAVIQAHAEAQNESVNGFINRAIAEAMVRDKAAHSVSEGVAEDEEKGRE